MNPTITFLIADDERAICTGLKAIVSKLLDQAVIVGCADTGTRALELLERYRPDIAIVDINMPEIDGLEVIRRANERELPTRFLILSGYNEFTYAQKAIRYGVKSYFLKPLNVEEFRNVVLQQCREILAERTATPADVPGMSRLVDSSRLLLLNRLLHSAGGTLDDAGLSTLPLAVADGPNCAALFLVGRQSAGADQAAPLRTLVREIVAPAFVGKPAECWPLDDGSDGSIAVLLNTPAPNAHPDWLRPALTDCAAELRRRTGTEVFVGLGDAVPDLRQTSRSYAQAREALTYRIYPAAVEIYDSSVITRQRPVFSQDSINFEPLIDALLANDTDAITTYCEAFFQSLLFVQTPPPSFLVGTCTYLVLNTQKLIHERRPDLRIDFDFAYDELNRMDSVEKMREWLTDCLLRYSDALTGLPGDDSRTIRKAKEYIYRNLDRNLKAKDVAAQVNLSEAYFTIYFKDKTGVNFREFLLSARMDLARQLLQSGTANISEVAYKTGYQDYRSFSRAFKNEVGMTPSEYQQSAQKQ